jgi:tagatose-1,6-bisphosphate aldolase non-catalytic subunit AgaZ/GatZ
VAGFARLFGDAVTGVERAGPTRLRLALRPDPRVAARAARLAAAETTCCTFFTFTLRFGGGSLTLDVTVPAAYTATLDAMAATAASAAKAIASG